VVTDLNGDGFADLVANWSVEDFQYQLSVLISQGDGTFSTPTDYPSGANWCWGGVVAGALNGDRFPSLVCSSNSYTASALLLFRGIGDGGLFPSVDISGSSFTTPALADFNGDGLLDVVAMSNMGVPDPMISFLSAGDGGFIRAPQSLGPDNGILRSRPETGDFNGDGVPDLAFFADYYIWHGGCDGDLTAGSGVGTLLGQGNGEFAAWAPIPIGGAPNLGSPTSADLDQDGVTDLLVSFSSPDSGPAGASQFGLYQVSFADGGTTQPVLTTDAGIDFLRVGDFNHDQAPDLLIVSGGITTLYLNGCP
jgi:hypothetical protein